MFIFSLIVECTLPFFLNSTGQINTTLNIYLLKYLFSPAFINFIFICIGYLAFISKKLKQTTKIYIVSLELVGICFTLFTVHCIFPSIYLIFSIPILFTIIYSSYLLLTITAASCIVLKIVSEIFIVWDPDKIIITSNNTYIANFIVSIFILIAFYIACCIVICFEKEKNLASIHKELERQKLKIKLQNDELTSINNRTALRKAFQAMEQDESENIYIFAMIDIDNFKVLNDTFGHIKGDTLLIQLSDILKKNCKNSIPFRYGGDEFCILFKNLNLESVLQTCNNIKNSFNKTVSLNEIELPLSLSFGIATYSKNITAIQLLQNADSALYNSKVVKNQISIYED